MLQLVGLHINVSSIGLLHTLGLGIFTTVQCKQLAYCGEQ